MKRVQPAATTGTRTPINRVRVQRLQFENQGAYLASACGTSRAVPTRNLMPRGSRAAERGGLRSASQHKQGRENNHALWQCMARWCAPV
eukprot:7023454-Prymnesium_polylepis.1